LLRTFLGAALMAMLAMPAAANASQACDDVGDELRAELKRAMSERRKEIAEHEVNGVKNKRTTLSNTFCKVDDDTYQVTMHVDTAEKTKLIAERYLVTLKRDTSSKVGWAIGSEDVQETWDGLRRTYGGRCYPFQKFGYDKYGMKVTASNGGVCEYYFEGTTRGLYVYSDDMAYNYTPPNYQDYLHLHKINKSEFEDDVIFNPQSLWIYGDPGSLEYLIAASFEGLDRKPAPKPEDVASMAFEGTGAIPAKLRDDIEKLVKETEKRRKESAFSGFTTHYRPGNKTHTLWLEKNDKAGIWLDYDNWNGFEVTFGARVNWPVGNFSTEIYGYYSDETMEEYEPYELEMRDDREARWHEVYKVHGAVQAGLLDPEMLEAQIDFGITVKQKLKALPFRIAGFPRLGASGGYKQPPLRVNSIRMNNQDLTWVRTGGSSGLVIFPEEVEAGTKVELSMDFATEAIRKINPSFNAMARFGWMPFVRFADHIEDFELEVKTPAKYTTLGIGHKVSEKVEDGVLTTKWKADNPVVFPTIIYGKYISATPGFDAKKLDDTVVPVTVYVDDVSTGQLAIDITSGEKAEDTAEGFRTGARGIRPKQLVPIAEQAANAINLFAELSGVDYPYGELNLVNDPAPALYGQAPSSLIYLGSFVFRGEGTMAGGTGSQNFLGGGGTRTAKFLKSVVAHEVGHQWWGSRVSNANSRNYWFVESLAEYFSAIYLEAVFGPKEYEEQVDEWRANILNADQKSSVQHASVLFPGTDGGRSYQAAVYSKGPYAFHLLREIFGDEKFFPFLKEFSQKLTEKGEVVTRDIQMVAEEALGGVGADGQRFNVDLDWFFNQWIRGVGMPEYRFTYESRRAEDGGWIVEGKIEQRVVIGNKFKKTIMDDTNYRAVVPITIIGKKEEYVKRVLIEGGETAFRLKVPERPVSVELNKDLGTLSHDVVTNKSW
jgi:hypothetical protein